MQTNTRERELMYDQLEQIIQDTNRYNTELFVIGDLNSVVGLRTGETCLGGFSRGRRNDNGQRLVEFCKANELKITNTRHQHKASRQITRLQTAIRNSKTVRVYQQMDYILIPKRQTASINNSRPYAGTTAESDHRIVIADVKKKHYHRFTRCENKLPISTN